MLRARKKQGTRKKKLAKRTGDIKRKLQAVKKQLPKHTVKQVRAALGKLRQSGWVQRPNPCDCGDRLVQVPWKIGMQRGAGPAYLRCAGCRSWFDCLAFSALPVVRLPLPKVLQVMERYFHGPVPESVQSAAHALGLSGGAGSSCVSHLHAAMRSHAHSRSLLHGLEAIAAFAFRTL